MQTVLGISASNRVWGNSEIAVKATLIAAHGAGAEVRFIRLPDLAIEQCRGCFKCLGPEGKCALDDDLVRLVEAVDAARGLVLASPVYFGLPPAPVVSLLDRLLVRTPREGSAPPKKRAVTVTIMGNRKWRGIAEPVVNMTVGLLGFDLAESLEFVAEGPGEVLSLPGAEDRLGLAGKLVASDEAAQDAAGCTERGLVGSGAGERGLDERGLAQGDAFPQARCPTCRADFFRIGKGALECPVCGSKADLAVYLRDGRFQRVQCEPRWGRPWLKSHVASWIMPSIQRYKARRREILRNVADLKRRYSETERKE